MTEKYTAYLELLRSRDHVLTTLAALALLTVLAWEVLNTLPEPWRGRLRSIYLIGGLIVYLATLIVLAVYIPGV